jgi:hypothetical protein
VDGDADEVPLELEGAAFWSSPSDPEVHAVNTRSAVAASRTAGRRIAPR